MDNLFTKIFHCLKKMPEKLVFAVSILFILLVGYINFVTGHELAFSVFYIIPVAFTAWRNGSKMAFAASLLCGVTDLTSFISSDEEYQSVLIPAWGSTVHVIFLFLISGLIVKVNNQMMLIQSMTRTDPLTGCYNRKYFYEILGRELEKGKRNGTSIALAYIDLDNFKTVNDTMGHKEGDFLLVKTVETVNHVIRTVDSLFRLGGDEFVIIINNPVSSELSGMFSRIKDNLRSNLPARYSDMVSLSIGVVTCFACSVSAGELIEKADKLMYDVKKSGKNNIRFLEV
jgi:diguanylate cyclase (GGDEF)-like protein